ncbi:MAG: hypothetical protein RMZ43_019605 [Nostoc sp. CmiVER01]|uniref:hypothetical protein n=1 Tax=Nostoc sp. CmiVER01 TaxID=3075384 RepID=UPI003D1606FB
MQISDYENPNTTTSGTRQTAALPSKRKKAIEGSTIGLMGVTGALMILEMSVHNIMLGGLIIAGAIAVAVAIPKQTQALLTNFEKIQRKSGVNVYAILFALLSIIFLLDFASAPADAQFFNNAQTWMNGAFGNAGNGQTQAVITLFFNVLRGLFLLYVGISLVRIVQAARNDEDWQTLARTPLIIVLSVFVGDLVTGLIIGAA